MGFVMTQSFFCLFRHRKLLSALRLHLGLRDSQIKLNREMYLNRIVHLSCETHLCISHFTKLHEDYLDTC